MTSLLAPTNTRRDLVPCPECGTHTSMEVVTVIEDPEELGKFLGGGYNQAPCPRCGTQVEAPVRVIIRLPGSHLPIHECVPIALLDDPIQLEYLARTDGQFRRVYSVVDLERSIMASLRFAEHREKSASC